MDNIRYETSTYPEIKIRKVGTISETNDLVVLRYWAGSVVPRKGGDTAYCKTFEEAKRFLLAYFADQMHHHRSCFEAARSNLKTVNEMKDPDFQAPAQEKGVVLIKYEATFYAGPKIRKVEVVDQTERLVRFVDNGIAVARLKNATNRKYCNTFEEATHFLIAYFTEQVRYHRSCFEYVKSQCRIVRGMKDPDAQESVPKEGGTDD